MQANIKESINELVEEGLSQAIKQLEAIGKASPEDLETLKLQVRRMVWNTLEVGDLLEGTWLGSVTITSKILLAIMEYIASYYDKPFEQPTP